MTNSTAERLWVLDMSTLRFRRDRTRTAISVLTRDGVTLTAMRVDPLEDDASVAHRAMDLVLRTSLITRRVGAATERFRVGLYDPFSAEVAVMAGDTPQAFGSGNPIPLGLAGCAATLVGRTLSVADEKVELVDRSPAALARAMGRISR